MVLQKKGCQLLKYATLGIIWCLTYKQYTRKTKAGFSATGE